MTCSALARCLAGAVLGVAGAAGLPAAVAGEVNFTEALPHVDISYGGKIVRIERIQDTHNILKMRPVTTGDQGPHAPGLSARKALLLPWWHADVAAPWTDNRGTR
jgi:hypothetical protein